LYAQFALPSGPTFSLTHYDLLHRMPPTQTAKPPCPQMQVCKRVKDHQVSWLASQTGRTIPQASTSARLQAACSGAGARCFPDTLLRALLQARQPLSLVTQLLTGIVGHRPCRAHLPPTRLTDATTMPGADLCERNARRELTDAAKHHQRLVRLRLLSHLKLNQCLGVSNLLTGHTHVRAVRI